jgi:hypothetical protein
MEYYNRLISEPLPVESKINEYSFVDVLNCEIANRKINSVSDATSLLTYTYLYRRLPLNPNYYKILDRFFNFFNFFFIFIVLYLIEMIYQLVHFFQKLQIIVCLFYLKCDV